jgi:hypothetical protein
MRLAPRDKWIPSDAPDLLQRDAWICEHSVASTVRICHYGFLRKREAFFKKAREIQKIWANEYDPRLEAAETTGENWAETAVPWANRLMDYTGTHPRFIHQWLRDRNFTI